MKPQYNPVEITQEGITSCGPACNPDSGCIGMDEVWELAASGDLMPGESFVYVAVEPCCHAYSKVKVTANTGKLKGKGQPELMVTLDMWDTTHQWQNEGVGVACMVPPSGDGHGLKHWKVTVTNTNARKTTPVWIAGRVDGTPHGDNRCP